MSSPYRPYLPDQPMLLPTDLREWLDEGHLAHVVSDIVEELDITALHALYRGDARRQLAYHPRLLLKVLVYGYATGVVSSRKLAVKLQEDIAFRFLAAGQFPSHRTLCRFRQQHLADFQALFVQVVQIAQEMGMTQLGTLAVDGTKMQAQASKHKAMSYGHMVAQVEQLEAEIAELLQEADQVDQAEDHRWGAEGTGTDLSAELQRRSTRLTRIQEAQAALVARAQAAQGTEDDPPPRAPAHDPDPAVPVQVQPDPKAQYNFTDPDSRIMRTSQQGWQQCYNTQAVVDAESQLIVATAVTQQGNDQGLLPVMLDTVQETLGCTPHTVLADAGYRNEQDLADLEQRGIAGYVALGREGRTRTGKCLQPATARMQAQLATPKGKALYATRKWIAEAPFGWLKQILGFRQFSVRSLAKVQGEWHLMCLALNIRRLGRLRPAT